MTAMLIILIFIAVFVAGISLLRFAVPSKSPVDRLENWMMDVREAQNLTQEPKVERRSLIQVLGGLAEGTGLGKKVNGNTRLELIRADIPLTGYEFNVARGILVAALALLAFALSRNIGVTLGVAAVAWIFPMLVVKSKKQKRYMMFSAQLGDALSILSNSLRAGFSFMQAVNSVAREMPNPIGKEFARLTKEMSLGLSTETSLANLTQRVQSDDLDLLVTAILIQKEIGGNLAEILDNIGVTIRERINIKREVKTLTAQGKLSGVVIALIPVALGFFLYLMDKSYIALLFTHPLGKIMLGMAIFNEIIGAVMIKKIISIDV